MLFRLVAVALLLLVTGCSGNAEPVAAPATTGVTASPTTTGSGPSGPLPSPTSPPSPSPAPIAPSASRVILTGDGLEVDGRPLLFGTPFGETVGPLTTALGPPSLDTGETSPFSAYGTCPGTVLRALEYAGGAVVLLFGDVDGPGQRFYAWNVRDRGAPDEAPRVRALAGDAATFELGIGTTVAQLRAGAAEGTLEVFEGDEIFGPGMRLADQSGGLYGSLTDASEAGSVTFVSGGSGCGE